MSNQTDQSRLVLVPWPETAWSVSGRLSGRTPLPLTDQGRRQAVAWSVSLAGWDIAGLYSSDEQASVETAGLLADGCGSSDEAAGSKSTTHKTNPAFAEVDIGLWEGLTSGELQRRYPKVYKRWRADPQSICPPEGESATHVQERLTGALEKVAGKLSGRAVVVVLGPLAFSLARNLLEQAGAQGQGELGVEAPVVYDVVETQEGQRSYCLAPIVFAGASPSPSV